MIKFQDRFAVGKFHFAKHRTGTDDIFAVGFGQREHGQPVADIGLVARMDVIEVVNDVRGQSDTGVFDVAGSLNLEGFQLGSIPGNLRDGLCLRNT